MKHKYTRNFCEENIWHLGRELSQQQPPEDFSVWILRSAGPAFLIFGQQAAPPGKPVFWDYHVILSDDLHQRLYDFDADAPFPCICPDYARRSFQPGQHLPPTFQAMIRTVALPMYLNRFSSDRSHMRNDQGRPLKPFPPWPCIFSPDSPLTLADLLNPESTQPGLPPFRLWTDVFGY
jgi:hypothetical protein